MKLILHIVRKDFLRLRLWLGLWAVVLATKVGIGFLVRSVDFSDASWDWIHLGVAVQLLTVFDGVMTFVLALLLVQEDRLVGTDLFWTTRPISGARLLAAKCSGAALILCGIPLLVALPWWLTCGFGIRELAWATAETVALQAAIILPAMLVASLTDSFQRVVLWTVVMLVGSAAGVALWGLFVIGVANQQDEELVWTRTWIAVTALVLAAVAGTTLQFLTRRFTRVLIVLAGGIALAIAIMRWWPARWSSQFEMTEVNPDRAAAVKLEFENATYSRNTNTGVRDDYLYLQMKVSGVPAAQALRGIGVATHTWRWPGGPALLRTGGAWPNYSTGEWFPARAALGLTDSHKDEETERVLLQLWQQARDAAPEERKQLGWPSQPHARSELQNVTAEVMVPGSLAARMRTQPPAYEGKVWLQLYRPELWLEMSLTPDGWKTHAVHEFRVVRAEHTTDASMRNTRFADLLNVALIETRPATLRDDWELTGLPPAHRELDTFAEATGVYLENRSLEQMDDRSETYPRSGMTMRVCSVWVSWRAITYHVPRMSRNGNWVNWQPSWLDGATLAVMGFRTETIFERDVKVDRFELAK